MKTKFVNCTSSAVTLTEADGGIHGSMFKLEKKDHPKSSFEMDLDTNATYRLYHLFVISSSNVGIVVLSDDLLDNKVITIMEVTPGVLSWEGTPRKYVSMKSDDENSTEEQTASTKSLGQWLSCGFSKWMFP